MTFESGVLYFLMGVCALSALLILWLKNIMHAALSLMLCLVSLAGIFGCLGAEFLAITQLMIYAGGIVVLIIFGIMLTNKIEGKPLLVKSQHWLSGTLVSVGFFVLLVVAFQSTNPTPVENIETIAIKQTGIDLLGNFAAPFEWSGVLLLVSLVAAAFTASSFKRNQS